MTIKERRQFGRRQTNQRGWIQIGGRRQQPCIVRNLSEQGAFLELEPPSWLPNQFELVIEPGTQGRPCEIRHERTGGFGVVFLASPAGQIAPDEQPRKTVGGDELADLLEAIEARRAPNSSSLPPLPAPAAGPPQGAPADATGTTPSDLPVGAERRQFGRRKTLKPAVINCADGSELRCTVVDISEGGAKIHLQDPAAAPERFELRIDVDNFAVRCRVVHRMEMHAGVKFVSAPYHAS